MKEFTQNLRKHVNKCFLIFAFIFGAAFTINAQDIWPQEQYYSLSEPENVVYNIDWQSFSSITSIVYYYWDEMDEYHEMTINEGSDYDVSFNDLIIYQSFINGMSPEAGDFLSFYAIFDGTQERHFGINVIQSYYASIFEENKNYDLSNPDDVFVNIDWATAEEITSVKVGGNELNSSYYYIEGYWLFFTQSYLSTVLTGVGNNITIEVTFDDDYSDEFVINTIQSGVNNATFDPEEFLIDMNSMSEYVETIITWNDASSIESMNVMMVEDEGTGVQVMPYEDYTVTPINASTATLRIYLGAKSASKEIYYFHVSIEVNFNVGEPKYLFLNLYEEYYFLSINIIPWNGGTTNGEGDYNVDEEVVIEAFANENYSFEKWIIDGETEITENPYTFNMPSHDLDIDAVFMSDYPEVISSNPVNWQNEVDINTLIYLTYNKNIIEGTSNNGFDDITLTYGMGDPWTINDIYIMNNNILVIEPATPLNITTGYNLNIPPESIEDAANPGTMMNGPYMLQFTTGWGDFEHGIISPENNIYSLMEPEDVVFDIIWGDELSFEVLFFYYWDQFDEYHELELDNPNDYTISGDMLTIKNSFITSLSPESGDELYFYGIFESGHQSYFDIDVIETTVPYLVPDEISYDLSNPHDLFTIIMFNTAESITSVSRNSTNLTEDTDYRIEGDWLFIHNSYLSPLLQNVSDEITLNVTFDTEDVSDLTITTIQSGITDATIDPQFQTINNDNELEYIDITITWNDASSVESLTAWEVDDAELSSFELTEYTVTPINAETALLRIFVGAKKNSMQAKYTDQFNVIIVIEFNVGASANYFLTIIDEYYFIYSEVNPANSGYVWGDWEYSVGSDVELLAEANWGYEFLCWKIDGIAVSTENPYVFVMPANDIYITAQFVPQGAELYTVTLISEPIGVATLSGAGEYAVGQMVNINVNDSPGYEFINWTNEESEEVSSSPMYSFTMLAENITLTAHFNDISNIISNNTDEVNIFPNPFSEVLFISNYESLSKITITTITGQIVAEYDNIVNGQINTTDLSNGFYMIILEKATGDKIIKKMIKQ
ncbi:MAG: X2-like carbohydrate binding domain-containing protein [Bacteroidales bacterium]|nr:X2-like carbohydrate binding domain-containing protein [Bacteroidales bacterium]